MVGTVVECLVSDCNGRPVCQYVAVVFAAFVFAFDDDRHDVGFIEHHAHSLVAWRIDDLSFSD